MPQLGVIEGFYGRPWTAEQRTQVFGRLAENGFSQYIFAPKSERALRSLWREVWPEGALEEIALQAQSARQHGLQWGVGLTPLALKDLDSQSKLALGRKLDQIAQCKPDTLCILFDDMRGDDKALAARQIAIIDWIASRDVAERIVMCPTYYSTDPILESVFGARPKNYWRELGRTLDAGIGFFWTGNKVCAESFCKYELESIADEMQRLPVLWDNYPVNDSRKLCNFLRIAPFKGREPWLSDYSDGHYANPMNQALASLLPLSTLAPIYALDRSISSSEDGQRRLLASQQQCWNDELAVLAANDPETVAKACNDFASRGLEGLDQAEKAAWIDRLQRQSNGLHREIVDWLQGGYAFDEACLTE